MGAHLSEVHIASMGIEKLIPKKEHLSVFLRVLARSAIGTPITIYSSHYRKPRPGQEMHVVLVDAGRSRQLGRVDFRDSLMCIKCGSRSEEHTSELQSLMRISYAVFCLKKKIKNQKQN